MCRLWIDEFAFDKHAPRKRTSPVGGGGCRGGGRRPSKVTAGTAGLCRKGVSISACRADIKACHLQKLETWITQNRG